MALGQAPYGADAIKRRLMRGNPGMGANGPRGGQEQLSPSNSKPAGAMIKGTPKLGGMDGAVKRRARKPSAWKPGSGMRTM